MKEKQKYQQTSFCHAVNSAGWTELYHSRLLSKLHILNSNWFCFITGSCSRICCFKRFQWDRWVRRALGKFFRSIKVKLQKCQGVEEPQEEKKTEGPFWRTQQRRGRQVSQVRIRRQRQKEKLPFFHGWKPTEQWQEVLLPSSGRSRCLMLWFVLSVFPF